MTSNNRLWWWLGLIFVLSFGALGFLGYQIYLTAPPIPKSVTTADGDVLFTREQIQAGQQAAYVAPDWSADWLHREALALQAIRTAEYIQARPVITTATTNVADAPALQINDLRCRRRSTHRSSTEKCLRFMSDTRNVTRCDMAVCVMAAL